MVSASTHNYLVPRTDPGWIPSTPSDWLRIPALTPFVLFDNSRLAQYATTLRLCFDDDALYVRFECEDPDIWGTMTERDEPIYDEEVVEVFLAPGTEAPTHYFEFEVSPNGVLFDAKIVNMGLGHDKIEVHTEWDCLGIEWQAVRHDSENTWAASLVIPWRSMIETGAIPTAWRANFTRIERPHGAEIECTCWSPTMSIPANFHEPGEFGLLRFE